MRVPKGEDIDIISVDTFAIEIKVRVLDPNFHRRGINCLMQGNADTGRYHRPLCFPFDRIQRQDWIYQVR